MTVSSCIELFCLVFVVMASAVVSGYVILRIAVVLYDLTETVKDRVREYRWNRYVRSRGSDE